MPPQRGPLERRRDGPQGVGVERAELGLAARHRRPPARCPNSVQRLVQQGPVTPDAFVILTGIAAALALGVLASLWPAWQAMSQPIVRNLRD